jgi:hypothetical protein
MSAYKGHRGPNVSQYVANLNQLSPPQGLLDEPAASEEDFSAFLNNEFFDVNNAPIANFDSPIDFDVDITTEQSTQPSLGQNSRKHSIHTSAEPNMEFNLNGKCILSLFLSLRLCSLLPSVWPRWLYIVCSSLSNRRPAKAHANPTMCPACIQPPTLRVLASQTAVFRCSPAAERTVPPKHAIARAGAEEKATASIVPRALYHITAITQPWLTSICSQGISSSRTLTASVQIPS